VISSERVEDATSCHKAFREIAENVDVESVFALKYSNEQKFSMNKYFDLPGAIP
jgi:hypothetical protein